MSNVTSCGTYLYIIIVPKTISKWRRGVVIGLRQIVIILYRRRIWHVKWKVNVLLCRKKQKKVLMAWNFTLSITRLYQVFKYYQRQRRRLQRLGNKYYSKQVIVLIIIYILYNIFACILRVYTPNKPSRSLESYETASPVLKSC